VSGETVLVADDRIDNVDFLRQYVLEPNGYQVKAATDGNEALRIALREDVDLVISDLVMPNLNGLELMEELRKAGKEIPTILMTFHGSEETAVNAFRLGARDYIIKPFTVEEMVEAIDRALAEARLRRERDELTRNLLQAKRQLEQQVKELRILYGLGRSVTSLLDLELVLNRVVEAAVYLTGAEEGSLMLIDEDSGNLYMRAARGVGEKYARGFRVRVEDSIAGRVLRAGEPIMLGGNRQDDTYKVKTGYLVKALLNVPLKVGDEVIGVLAVNNRSTARAFSSGHLRMLTALADYASIAIYNAGLYQDLVASRDQVEKWGQELEVKVGERTAALEATQTQLLRSEKLAALGHMAAGVVQEVSNPISTILGHVRLLESKLAGNERVRTSLEAIEREALRCQRTMQSLFDFARRMPPRTQPIDANELLEAAWHRIENDLPPYPIEIVRGFDPHLPLVPADHMQMEQALYQLVRNACEAMRFGGTLRLITRSVGSEVQIIVADTGQGLTPEQLRHIFDPFYFTSERGDTAGMGLSIAYGVIERHGGTIEVESQEGKGTTFTIRLPLAPGENSEPGISNSVGKKPGEAGELTVPTP
jgi:signal transduction histidine kinase/DNA-binding response OmpR family regulator